MTPEVVVTGATGSESAAGANQPVDTPATQDTSSVPTEQHAGPANAEDVQGATTETDPLEGVPTLDELNKLPDDAQYKKSLIQLRSAIDQTFKPRLQELSDKYKLFEPVADRFGSPEEVQQLVDWKQSLFGWEPDPDTGQLIPATASFAEQIAQTAPETADYLAADLMNGITVDPDTGRQVARIDLALEAMAKDPTRRAKALEILGGVEPSSIAPAWQPTVEELNAIPKDPERPSDEERALQEVYKRMPYDERSELAGNTPDFIRNYLRKEMFQQNLMRENEEAKQRQQAEQQQRQQHAEQQAHSAGDQQVEQQFRSEFTGFAKSIVERWQPIKPLDPAAAQALGLDQQGLAAKNQEIQQINQTAGLLVSLAVGALAHRDTRFMAEEFFKSIGAADDKMLQGFDSARLEFAQSARNYGYLNFKSQNTQNGGPRPDLSTLNSNASSAMRRLKGHANQLAGKIQEQLDKFFVARANSYNQTLNGAAQSRPPIGGTPFDPTTAATQRPTGWQTREELQRQYGG